MVLRAVRDARVNTSDRSPARASQRFEANTHGLGSRSDHSDVNPHDRYANADREIESEPDVAEVRGESPPNPTLGLERTRGGGLTEALPRVRRQQRSDRRRSGRQQPPRARSRFPCVDRPLAGILKADEQTHARIPRIAGPEIDLPHDPRQGKSRSVGDERAAVLALGRRRRHVQSHTQQ
jgi:hypothetical protein